MTTYDPKCDELARHFLTEETPLNERRVQRLAATIQDAIEDWFAMNPPGKI